MKLNDGKLNTFRFLQWNAYAYGLFSPFKIQCSNKWSWAQVYEMLRAQQTSIDPAACLRLPIIVDFDQWHFKSCDIHYYDSSEMTCKSVM